MSARNTLHVETDPNNASSYVASMSSAEPAVFPESERAIKFEAARDTSGTQMFIQSGLSSYWQEGEPILYDESLIRQANCFAKRAFDILFALSALLALAPLFLFVAIIIKLTDHGSIFFFQDRVGKDGKTFKIIKFRSMYLTDCDPSGVMQTTADDKRVMPIGSILRRTSIDELPQLLNIVRGDMSVVGPRPHVAGQIASGFPYQEVVPYYSYREKMRPGLTGWAQANGYRGPTVNLDLARRRIDHDVAYVQNFSFFLDIRIILQTASREFFSGSGF